MTLAASNLNAWIIGSVALLTLVAIGHLAARWQQHKAPFPTTPNNKPRKPRAPAKRPPNASPPPNEDVGHWGDANQAPLALRREWVRERVVHWWVIANRVHGASIDDVPTVTFSPRLKHALGWASSQRNLLKFSDHHLLDKSKQVTDETVAHEVAHIFADRHYGQFCRHGKLWKRTMIAMGQKPDVTFKDTPEDGAEEDEAVSPPAPKTVVHGQPVNTR